MLLSFIFFAAQSIASIISVFFLARLLSVEFFGVVFFILLAFNIISVLDGVRSVVIYEIAANKGGNESLGRIQLGALVINFGLGVLTFLACIVLSNCIEKFDCYSTEAAAIGGAWFFYFVMSFYWAVLDANGYVVMTQAARATAWIMLYIAFVLIGGAGLPILAYVLSLLLMNLMLVVIFSIFANRYVFVAGYRTDFATVSRLTRSCANLVLFNLSGLILATFDRVALMHAGADRTLGYYSAVYEAATKPNAVFRVVSSFYYPKIACAHANDSLQAIRLWEQVSSVVIAGSIMVYAFLNLISEKLILLVLGENYISQTVSFRVLLIGFPIVAVGYATNMMLNASGDFHSQRKIYFEFAILACLLFFFIGVDTRVETVAWFYLAARLCDVFLLLSLLKKYQRTIDLKSALLLATLACGSVITSIGLGNPTMGSTFAVLLSIMITRKSDLRFTAKIWKKL